MTAIVGPVYSPGVFVCIVLYVRQVCFAHKNARHILNVPGAVAFG